jgi:hypothetical protein
MTLSQKDMQTIRWKTGLKWEGYELIWCDLCRTAAIVCSFCHNSSCNGSGCEKCLKDHERFPKKDYNRDYFIAKDGEEGKTTIEFMKENYSKEEIRALNAIFGEKVDEEVKKI